MSLCWVEVGLDQFRVCCSQLSAGGAPRINFKKHTLTQPLFLTPVQRSRATSQGLQQADLNFQEFHGTILCENCRGPISVEVVRCWQKKPCRLGLGPQRLLAASALLVLGWGLDSTLQGKAVILKGETWRAGERDLAVGWVGLYTIPLDGEVGKQQGS